MPAALVRTVREAAEAAYPDESCGLLIGRQEPDGATRIGAVEPAANVATGSRRDRFAIDPRVQFALMRRLRGSGERMIGHYHSHPDHVATPSEHDLAMAFEPDLVWLITSVVAGRAVDIRAWMPDLAAGRFRALALHIGEPGSP